MNQIQARQILLHTPDSLLSIIKAENGESKSASCLKLKTEHLRIDGKPILFEIFDESDGTRRLLDLAPMLLDIWERDQYGASHLTSLAEYKVTEGLNYANGYLNGRFGAIPFIGNIKNLLK